MEAVISFETLVIIYKFKNSHTLVCGTRLKP